MHLLVFELLLVLCSVESTAGVEMCLPASTAVDYIWFYCLTVVQQGWIYYTSN